MTRRTDWFEILPSGSKLSEQSNDSVLEFLIKSSKGTRRGTSKVSITTETPLTMTFVKRTEQVVVKAYYQFTSEFGYVCVYFSLFIVINFPANIICTWPIQKLLARSELYSNLHMNTINTKMLWKLWIIWMSCTHTDVLYQYWKQYLNADRFEFDSRSDWFVLLGEIINRAT